MASFDIPEITVTGVPIKPIGPPATAAQASGSWSDQLFQTLLKGGSAYLDFEMQSRAMDDAARRAQQYGSLYNTPGSFFPVTGQGPNGQATLNPQFVTLAVVVLAVGAGIYIFAKA